MDTHAPAENPQPGLGYQPALDGIRALAVGAVVYYHGVTIGRSDLIGRGGFLGVDIFFALSGFLITTLLIEEQASSTTISLPAFWWRRIRRLYPMLLVTVAIVLLMATFVDPERATTKLQANVLATLFYYMNWHVIANPVLGLQSHLGHTWSLAIEEQWYFVWPVVLLLTKRWWPRRQVVTIGTLLTVALALTVWTATRFTQRPITVSYVHTLTYAPTLLLGAALAFARRCFRVGDEMPPWVINAISSVSLIGLGYFLATATPSQPSLYRGGLLAVAACSCALVLVALQPTGPVRQVLALRPLVYIGKISYGIYLLHIPVFAVVTRSRTGLDGWALFGGRCAAALLAAALGYHLLEQPIRRGRWSARLPMLLTMATAGLVALSFSVATGSPGGGEIGWADIVHAYETEALSANAGTERMIAVGGTTAAELQSSYGGTYRSRIGIGMSAAMTGCHAIPIASDLSASEPRSCKSRRQVHDAVRNAYRPTVVAIVLNPSDFVVRNPVTGDLTELPTDALVSGIDRVRSELGARNRRLVIVVDPCDRNGKLPSATNSIVVSSAAPALVNAYRRARPDIAVVQLPTCPPRPPANPIVRRVLTRVEAADAWRRIEEATRGQQPDRR